MSDKQPTARAAAASNLSGCGRGTAKTETHQTTNRQWSPPVAPKIMDDLKSQEIDIWTNTAGDKSLGITRDGGVWFRIKF